MLALEIAITVLSVAFLWKMGDKSLWGPALGLCSQVLWFPLILLNGMHGLWPTWVAFTGSHARNLFKWYKEKP